MQYDFLLHQIYYGKIKADFYLTIKEILYQQLMQHKPNHPNYTLLVKIILCPYVSLLFPNKGGISFKKGK